MKIGPCKLCDETKHLVRAHIIPDVYYRPVLRTGPALRLSDSLHEHPSTIRTGDYDDELLCERCEATFSEPERYVKTLFQDHDWSKQVYDWSIGDVGVLLPEFDYVKLKRFCLGLAWKASATTRTFFCSAKLGPREHQLRTMVRAGLAGAPDEFATFVMRFRPSATNEGPIDASQLILSPAHHRMLGYKFVRFYLGAFSVSVKVDSRPLPERLLRCCVAPNEPLCIVLRDFWGSNVHKHVRRIAGKHPG